MRKKINKKMKMVKNHLRQEMRTWPLWARIAITILIVTGFFLTAAATVFAVKKLKKKN